MCHIFARITGAWKESEGKMIVPSFLFYLESIVILSSLSLKDAACNWLWDIFGSDTV